MSVDGIVYEGTPLPWGPADSVDLVHDPADHDVAGVVHQVVRASVPVLGRHEGREAALGSATMPSTVRALS